MKKRNIKRLFISFYQYDADEPVIIGFDSIEAAREAAREDIRQALPDKTEWKTHLELFDNNGYVTIGEIHIYATEIRYCQSTPTKA